MTERNPFASIITAHNASLGYQADMQAVAQHRDELIRLALRGGATAASIAAVLNTTRQRVQQMANSGRQERKATPPT